MLSTCQFQLFVRLFQFGLQLLHLHAVVDQLKPQTLERGQLSFGFLELFNQSGFVCHQLLYFYLSLLALALQ